MAGETIRIKLKSYDHAILDQAAKQIVNQARKTGASVSGPVPLPTERSVYTVNRSPHIDKKSREQFEMRVHKRYIEIRRPTDKTMDALVKMDISAGVYIEIKEGDKQ